MTLIASRVQLNVQSDALLTKKMEPAEIARSLFPRGRTDPGKSGDCHQTGFPPAPAVFIETHRSKTNRSRAIRASLRSNPYTVPIAPGRSETTWQTRSSSPRSSCILANCLHMRAVQPRRRHVATLQMQVCLHLSRHVPTHRTSPRLRCTRSSPRLRHERKGKSIAGETMSRMGACDHAPPLRNGPSTRLPR